MALTVNTVRGERADRLLLMLHGFGADENDLPGLLTYLDPEGRFVVISPRAPIAAPPGFAWFDLTGGPTPDDGPPQGFTDALGDLDVLLDTASDEHGLSRAEAVLLGFSQGGSMALALALGASEKPRPAGVLAMSTWLPGGVDFAWEDSARVPVLVQHGEHDPMIPATRGRELARTLVDHHVPTVFRSYPMGHEVALESVRDARDWIDQVFAGELPNEPVAEVVEGPVKAVTTADFDREVLRSELPVIVDFWAPWCGPCRQVGPIVEQIATMRDGAYKVVRVNIDEEPVLAKQYDVQSIPLIGLFRNGRLERQSLGAKPRSQVEAELGMLVIP